MSNFSFTKLFSSITESTIWAEPDHVRIMWITLLAMCDRQGRVYATIPGLAGRARVSVEQCEEALTKFFNPDKYSRSKEFDGRRIQEIDGGWVLLNYERYRAMRDAEAGKERKRNWAARHRAVNKNRLYSATVDHGRPGVAQCGPKAEDRSQKTEDREEGEVAAQAPPPPTQPKVSRGWAIAVYASAWKEAYGTSPEISSKEAGQLAALGKRMLEKKGGDVEAAKAVLIDYVGWYMGHDDYWKQRAHPVSGLVTTSTMNEYKAGK